LSFIGFYAYSINYRPAFKLEKSVIRAVEHRCFFMINLAWLGEIQDLYQIESDALKGLLETEELQPGARTYLKVSKEKLAQVETLLSQPTPAVQEALACLHLQPLSPILKKMAANAISIADSLHRDVEVKLAGLTVEAQLEHLAEVFASCVHLLRNAVHHETKPRLKLPVHKGQ